jgi:SAM-dependent methyltransferase
MRKRLASLFGIEKQQATRDQSRSIEQWPLDECLDMVAAFWPAEGEGRDYFTAHFRRYLETIGLIGHGRDGHIRILELGSSFPYAFSILLKYQFPNAEISLGQNDEDFQHRHLELTSATTGEQLSFQVMSFNGETDSWPFETESFDVVLCMEILEHLLLDPLHMYREAHRVLKSQGEFIVTTPNLASVESLQKLMDYETPYRFGVYSRHGPYGRHNREYVPREVALLGECSAFETNILTTRDVYADTCDTGPIKAALGDRAVNEMRRQNIFYKGIKQAADFRDYPSELYDFDPGRHAADIRISLEKSQLQLQEPIAGEAVLQNTGRYTWSTEGENHTTLRVILLDAGGKVLSRDFRTVRLPEEVPPGVDVRFEFSLEGQYQAGDFLLRFDMVHEQVCWFSDLNAGYADLAITVSA